MKVWDEKSALYIMYKGNHKGKQSRRSPNPMAISLKNGEKQRKTLKSGDFKVDSLAGAQGLELLGYLVNGFIHSNICK